MVSRSRMSHVRRLCAGLLAGAALWASGVASAQDQDEPGPIGRAVETINPVNWNWPTFNPPPWKMPQLLPAREDTERIVKKKNSLWDDVSSTTQKSWQKTKEVLHPQNLNPMNWWASPAESTRPNTTESPGFFGSLFQPAQEPEARVATVTDFLGQERP